jgi:hypothetical protein
MVVHSQDTGSWLSPMILPVGVTHRKISRVGRNAETGGVIRLCRFRVHDKVTGRKSDFRVLVDDTTSRGEVEEMVGNAMESWLIDVRIKHSKPPPTPAQRKEIGKILNQIKDHALKRGESSNNKIYYAGIKR